MLEFISDQRGSPLKNGLRACRSGLWTLISEISSGPWITISFFGRANGLADVLAGSYSPFLPAYQNFKGKEEQTNLERVKHKKGRAEKAVCR